MTKQMIGLLCAGVALSACSSPQEKAEDRVESQAEASAKAAGSAVAAFGLTERQLLDADIIEASGAEAGDVTAVVRAPDGQVAGLLVEIDKSNPDRFVQIPIDSLRPVRNLNDIDLATDMTRAQIEALPDATPGAR